MRSAYREAVKARDRRASMLGYVPRPMVLPPPDPSSVDVLRCMLTRKAHAALVKRITSP